MPSSPTSCRGASCSRRYAPTRRRGEPRGKLGQVSGHCLDCRRCVQVCPTGIDIRNGLQMECMGCANCIDACDEVMDRVGRARGLVRYDSQRGFEATRRGFWRPRVFLYAGLGLLGLIVSVASTSRRTAFEARATRVAGLPYTIEGGLVRNFYMMQIQNKEAEPRVYAVAAVPGTPGLPRPDVTVPLPRLRLEAMTDARVPAFATLAMSAYTEPFPLIFAVTDSSTGDTRRVKVEFLGP